MNWKSIQPWLCIVLLFFMVVLQAIQVSNQFARNSQCVSVIEESANKVRNQNDAYTKLLSDYESIAYGPGLDRISEQQLVAEETQLLALQIIASQNSVLMDFISVCR